MKRPASAAAAPRRQKKRPAGSRLPVSSLCGFLGAGKTTLLKHILESKRADGENGYKFAVIVNDMAELNIDKSLIDQSQLIQSEDVIAMQNGCVCCTLQNDLVTQIMDLARKNTFDYMIIEASGVSEPAQIAKLFADCEEDHDHGKEHAGHTSQLNQFARLDTCVTVVDCADFFSKFREIRQGPNNENFPQLLVEQIEYANVVILNKTDLVSQAQLAKVREQVALLNPRAKLLDARGSKVDVAEVVNSSLYKADDFFSIHDIDDLQGGEEGLGELKECCMALMSKGGVACCRLTRTRDSGLSRMSLGYTNPRCDLFGAAQEPRHASRFGIKSIVYQARRPFHPERFDETFVGQFFVLHEGDEEEEEAEDAEKKRGGRGGGKRVSRKQREEERERRQEKAIRKRQREAARKQKRRTEQLGDLFRSKGFLWLANRHDLMGTLSHASNVLNIEFSDRWTVLLEKGWKGTLEAIAAARKDWAEPWGDRRQELVFIGRDLKDEAIQQLLDGCLLTDEEMERGPDGWKAIYGDVLLDHMADSHDEGEA